MPRYQYIQNSFSAGEISPKVFPRTDTAEYKNGLKEAVNFIPGDTGGMFRRTGSVNPYNLLLPNQDTGPAQTLSVSMKGVDYVFICQPERLRAITFSGGSASIGGFVSMSIDTLSNYMSAYALDPFGFSIVSVGTFSIIAHSSGEYEPWVIFDFSGFVVASEWGSVLTTSVFPNGSYPEIPPAQRYPYTDFGNTGVSITPSASTGSSITLTSSTAFFEATDVGSFFIIEDPTHSDTSQKFLVAEVTGYTSSTVVDARVDSSSGTYTPGASFNWSRNAWSKTLGYPKVVGSVDNRVIFGNTKTSPRTIWGSEQGFVFWFNGYAEYLKSTATGITYYYYGSYGYIYINSVVVYYPSVGTYEYSLSSDYGGEIRWVADFSGMLVGTDRRIHLVTDSSGSSGPSNRSVNAPVISSIACTFSPPVQSPTALFTLADGGNRVFMLEKSEQDRGYAVAEITAVNPGIKDEIPYVKGSFRSITWDEMGNVLILITNNNTVRYFKHKKESAVAAWSRATFDGDIYSIGFLPQIDTAVVTGKTSANKGEITYAGFMRYEGLESSVINSDSEAFYLDLASSITTDISGDFTVNASLLDVYAENTVTVIDEDGDITEVAIDSSGNGSLGVEKADQNIIIGYPYESRFTLLTPEVGPNQLLSSQGDIIRIDRATAYLYKSWAGEYSGDGNTFYDMEIEQKSNTMKYQFDVNASPDIESNITIKTSKPLPLNVTGIVLRGVNNP